MSTLKAMWQGTFKTRSQLESELMQLKEQVQFQRSRADFHMYRADSMERMLLSLDSSNAK